MGMKQRITHKTYGEHLFLIEEGPYSVKDIEEILITVKECVEARDRVLALSKEQVLPKEA